MSHLVGLDIGTSSVKGLLVDHEGRVAARASRELSVDSPMPSWNEQAPRDWWSACSSVLQSLTSVLPSGGEITGIGLSGQMVGAVLLDAKGAVLRPCIMWSDSRSFEETQEITSAIGKERILEATCNAMVPNYIPPKLLWVRKHEQSVYSRIATVLFPKDYVGFRLTGELATDMSDASAGGFFDTARGDWSDVMLGELDVPKDWMPQCAPSGQVVGRVRQDVAEETGIPAGTPVVAGAGDQVAGAVGTGLVDPSTGLLVTGSSGVVLCLSDAPARDVHGLGITSVNYAEPGVFALIGTSLAAGYSLKWVRDKLARDVTAFAHTKSSDPYAILAAIAAEAPVRSGGLLFLPYLTGERTPHPDAHARGVYCGLTPQHGWPEMVRAVMEGVAFSLRDILGALEGLGVKPKRLIASGGGARSVFWRQVQADVLGLPVATMNIDEGPAFGAALLAGVGTGVYRDTRQAAETAVSVVSELEPDAANQAAYDTGFSQYRELYYALKEFFVGAYGER